MNKALNLLPIIALAVFPAGAHAEVSVKNLDAIAGSEVAKLQDSINQDTQAIVRERVILFMTGPTPSGLGTTNALRDRAEANRVKLRNLQGDSTFKPASTGVLVTLTSDTSMDEKLGFRVCSGACAGCACGAIEPPLNLPSNATVARRNNE